jgi:1-acyl-sn-glycerol-3-phosphate acyltransferase
MPPRYPALIPLRILGLMLNSAFWFIPVTLTIAFRLTRVQAEFVRLYYQVARRCFGIRVRVRGQVAKARPLLLVSNHFTYLDVPVLGSILPVRFTPKTEVGSWPVIGLFCRMSRCIFIDRRPSQTKRNQAELIRAVRRGDLISLFPEGTTNEGTSLLPFRSSYFSLAVSPYNVTVQPLTVRYAEIDGKPMQREWLPLVGWYGEMTFFPHFLALLSLPSITVEIEFLPPLPPNADRKALALQAREVIREKMGDWK